MAFSEFSSIFSEWYALVFVYSTNIQIYFYPRFLSGIKSNIMRSTPFYFCEFNRLFLTEMLLYPILSIDMNRNRWKYQNYLLLLLTQFRNGLCWFSTTYFLLRSYPRYWCFWVSLPVFRHLICTRRLNRKRKPCPNTDRLQLLLIMRATAKLFCLRTMTFLQILQLLRLTAAIQTFRISADPFIR